MLVYRICDKEEIDKLFENYNIEDIGFKIVDKNYYGVYKPNNHKYKNNKKYLHFFKDLENIFYLSTKKDRYICTYEIDDKILNKTKGIGKYLNFINYIHLIEVEEYAINIKLLDFNNLLKVDLIEEDIDYEDFLNDNSLSCYIKNIYEKEDIKKLEKSKK